MYKIKELDNGIKIIMHKFDHLNSSTLGFIVKSGSFYENEYDNGISHFIEHMLFKGTKTLNTRELAEAIDDVGGQINAFTSKEHTCFYTKVISEHLPVAINILGDMLNNSKFEENDIEKEKGVIIEEIKMYQDFPEDLVYELLDKMIYDKIPLAYPILGNIESVNRLNKKKIIDYFYEKYTPANIVISLVGKFDEVESFELLNQAFGNFNIGSKPVEYNTDYVLNMKNNIRFINKDVEQFNICIGFPGPSEYSDDIFPIMVVNNLLGGTISSRLFQRIREEEGLSYNIESSITSYNDSGFISVYAGLNLEQVLNVSKLIKEEIDKLKENYITENELEKAKEHLKGSYILSLESSFNKMYEMGKNVLHNKEIETPESVIKNVKSISLSDIIRVIDKYFDYSKINIACVGKIKNENKLKKDLAKVFELGGV
ncbi:MAG: pitrilysin family protein [Gudongella sp.]|nr:pitrilysin family protein [Gudongella sp.]